MTANDKDKEKESTEQTDAERLEAIKREEEAASAYYGQAETEQEASADDLYKPLPEIDDEKEEMSFLKTVAFLGFGLAALAIVFILFFMRDLDERVVNMNSAVAKLDEKIEPFKKEVKETVDKIGSDVARLEGKLGNYERTQAILALKRALITVKEITSEANPEVQSKSGAVVAGIQALLQELGGEPSTAPATAQPAPAEAPPSAETAAPPAAEQAVETAPVEETAPAETAPAESAVEEEPAAEQPAAQEDTVESEATEEHGETAAEEQGEAAEHESETNVGEIELSSDQDAPAETTESEADGGEELIEDE
ncbi:MAG: hypothetical protein ACE5G9_01020 [Nitrospinales bacterium]